MNTFRSAAYKVQRTLPTSHISNVTHDLEFVPVVFPRYCQRLELVLSAMNGTVTNVKAACKVET
jgi:hypothetical protein